MIFVDWLLIFKEGENRLDKDFITNFLWEFKREEITLTIHQVSEVKVLRDTLQKMKIRNSIVKRADLNDDDFFITTNPCLLTKNGFVVYDKEERFGEHLSVCKKMITKEFIIDLFSGKEFKKCSKNNIILYEDGDTFISPVVKKRLENLSVRIS